MDVACTIASVLRKSPVSGTRHPGQNLPGWAMQHRVMVDGHYYSVGVYQEAKTVWYATAEYRGEVVTVKAKSESRALKRWREAAEAMDKA